METSFLKQAWLATAMILSIQIGISQPPQIDDILPISGFVGDTITLTGQQLGPNPSQNLIWIGGQPARIISATSTQLSFEVPNGAQPGPIGLKNLSNGLYIQSDSIFVPQIQCVEPLAFNSFQFTNSNSNISGGEVLSKGFFNSDLKPDLANASGFQLDLYLNQAEPATILKDSLTVGATINLPEPIQSLHPVNLDGDLQSELVIGISNGFWVADVTSNGASMDTVEAFRDSASTYVDFVCLDWDQDGIEELIGLDSSGQRLAVFSSLSGTSIGFDTPFYVDLGIDGLAWLTAGQFEEAGQPQLIAGGLGKDSLQWIQNVHVSGNLSNSSFAVSSIYLGGNITGKADAADLDGDHIDELLVPAASGSNLGYSRLKHELVGGSINWHNNFYNLGVEIRQLGLIDFDGDGQEDLWSLPTLSALGIIFQKDTSTVGTGGFGDQMTVGLPNGSTSLLPADWNGDQAQDVMISTSNNQITYLVNQGRPHMQISGLPIDEGTCPNDSLSILELFPTNSSVTGPGIDPNGLAFSPQGQSSGELTLLHTYTNSVGCARSMPISFQVKSLPQLSFSILDPSANPTSALCIYDNLTYELIGIPSGSMFSPGSFKGPGTETGSAGQGTFSLGNILDPTILEPVEDDGIPVEIEISYSLDDPLLGCSDTVSKLVTINPRPAAATQVDFTPFLDAQELCISSEQIFRVRTRYALNDPIRLEWYGLGIQDSSELDGEARFSFGWIDDDTLSSRLMLPNPNNRSIVVPYRITDTLTGCFAENPATKIEIIPEPTREILLITPSQICEDQASAIQGNISDPDLSILEWTWIPQGQDTSQGTSVTIFPTEAGSFGMRCIIETTGQCVTSIDTAIEVIALPEASFVVEDECEGVSFQIGNQSTGDSIQYNWFLDSILIDSVAEPVLVLDSVGSYTLILEVEEKGICQDSQVQELAVLDRLALSPQQDKYVFPFNQNEGGWIPRGQSPSWDWGIDSLAPISRTTDDAFWQTGPNQPYQPLEDSWLISPCLDLRGLDRPMVSFDKWADMLNGADGAVLEVKSQNGWEPLGDFFPVNRSPAVNWYNAASLNVQPGEQTLTSKGWTGEDSAGWTTVRHHLDAYQGDSSVQFRIAFATSVSTSQKQGIGFDNFRIQNRQRKVLLETLVNDLDVERAANSDSIQHLLARYPLDVNFIQYHTADPQPDQIYSSNPADHGARALFYAVALPGVGILDGQAYQGPIEFIENTQVSRLSLADPTFSIRFNLDPITEKIQVLAESKVDLDSMETLFLTGWLESNQNNSSNGVQNDLLSFSPNAGGGYLLQSWAPGSQQVLDIPFPSAYRAIPDSSLLVFAFIQNINSGEVFQSEIRSMRALKTTHLPAQESENWSLSPNPSSGLVWVNLKNPLQYPGLLTIRNLLGQEIIKIQLDPGVNNQPLDFSQLPTGTYWVSIQGLNAVYASKAIRIW